MLSPFSSLVVFQLGKGKYLPLIYRSLPNKQQSNLDTLVKNGAEIGRIAENLLEYATTMVCEAVKGEPVIRSVYKPFEDKTYKFGRELFLMCKVWNSKIERLA